MRIGGQRVEGSAILDAMVWKRTTKEVAFEQRIAVR